MSTPDVKRGESEKTMINYEFVCTETFTPWAKTMTEAGKECLSELLKEAVKQYSKMKNVEDVIKPQDYIEITKQLLSMPHFSKKELTNFSNSLKIKKIKEFLLARVPEECAVLYTEFIREVFRELKIYGNDQKKTKPVGVVRTALNELEKEGYVIKLETLHKVYIYRIK